MSKTSPFWRRVRELRHEIAIRLYMEDHRELDVFTTPSIRELKEGGYWDRACILALRKTTVEEPGRHETLSQKPRRLRLSLNRG